MSDNYQKEFDKMAKDLHPAVAKQVIEDSSVDYTEELRKIGWAPEIIPGQTIITFRARKGKTVCIHKENANALNGLYNREAAIQLIWKDIYEMITE